MASNVTLVVIRDKIRDRGEFDSTDYFPSSQLNEWINDSIAAFYDELVKADPARYLEQGNITVVSGTEDYALPSDFYKLVGVDLLDSNSASGYRQMDRFMWNERHLYHGDKGNKYDAMYEIRNSRLYIHPSPTWALTDGIRVNYIPTAPSLSSDSDTWDTINLWVEWVILDVCEKCAIKEDSSTQAKYFRSQRDTVLGRILSSAEADNAKPRRVTNVRRQFRRYRRRSRWFPS